MTLPSIDLGLMSEHLAAHEGIIHKLENYLSKVTSTELRETIDLQVNVMRAHVKVMLMLINPYLHEYVVVPPLSTHKSNHGPQANTMEQNLKNKPIALEARSTAKSMANENFTSALFMKNHNVKQAHIEMALQQVTIQEKYNEYIKKMGWAFVPYASLQEQIHTYQNYQRMLI
ncbi:spore coat protein [Halobacillus seohaensis]|uniref:Spore coat protein n=1 Tax=Halobacillus seohaensis TaxID=447421 RepID=A0ABW2ERL2_9BACI